MVAALDKMGMTYAYVPFAGEQHGFRQAANIQRAAEVEYSFYCQVFGFDCADDIAPVEVNNLS